MSKLALKLVSKAQFYVEEGEFWGTDEESAHSLHFAISLPDSFSPGLASFFLRKYTAANDVIFDPFCGRGTVPLEAALLGRTAVASDINPICVKVAKAKLEPIDLVETALFVQSVNFSRPVSLEGYSEYFEPFFDPDTYREIVNLKAHLKSEPGQMSNFVELIAMSLLHGHTAGYFSAYSLPQISVLPSRQREMNDKRGKLPEYRAVAPRILRKAGTILRDGDVLRLQSQQDKHGVFLSDARDLTFLGKGSVDLVITAPPRPFSRSTIKDLWLKSWFIGLSRNDREELSKATVSELDLESWLGFMNEVFFELARVVKSGGRAVIDLKEVFDGRESVKLDGLLSEHISTNLSAFWECECLFINQPNIPQVTKRFRGEGHSGLTNRVLVLRRK